MTAACEAPHAPPLTPPPPAAFSWCTLAVVKRCLLGQLVAFAVAGTGVFTTLLVDQGRSFPLLQSLTAYAALVMVYVPLYAYVLHSRLGWWSPRSISSFKDFRPFDRWWRYAVIAVVDLEANYVVVKAYQYTDMTSVQLLDCFTVPFVMALSGLFLSASYTKSQVFGAIVAVGGLVLLVGLDADGLSRSSGGPNLLLGDGLCVLSSALYAASNVACEKLVKVNLNTNAPLSGLHDEQGATSIPQTMSTPGSSVAEGVVGGENTALLTDGDIGTLAPSDATLPPSNVPALESIMFPSSPHWLPSLEYLAVMPLFALLFAFMQCCVMEGSDIRSSLTQGWSVSAIAYQNLFGLSMLTVYTGMPCLFYYSSATLANLSLLTADVYAILWNVTIFHIDPRWEFFFAYWITVSGIVWFDTDGFQGRVAACVKTAWQKTMNST